MRYPSLSLFKVSLRPVTSLHKVEDKRTLKLRSYCCSFTANDPVQCFPLTGRKRAIKVIFAVNEREKEREREREKERERERKETRARSRLRGKNRI